MNRLFKEYEIGDFFDEMFSARGIVRSHYQRLARRFGNGGWRVRSQEAPGRKIISQSGITFTVYSGDEGTERIFPFDLIPRIIPAKEWEHIERGLIQRLIALNLFLHDVYHEQRIIKEKVVPEGLSEREALSARVHGFRRPEEHLHPLSRGTDLIRDRDGVYTAC